MTKLLALCLAPLAFAGCVDDSPVTPLAQLRGAQVSLTTVNDSPLIDASAASPSYLTLSVPGECAHIGDDVTIDLDGMPWRAEERGGEYQIDGNGCIPIIFDLDRPTTATHNTLLIRDSNTTWTIEADNLFANDFAVAQPVVAGGRAHVAWQSAAHIDAGAYAELTQGGAVTLQASTDDMPSAIVTTGNTIDLAIPDTITGDAILSVNAARKAATTRCDGPATCTVQISAGRDLALTIAPPSTGPAAPQAAPRR